MEREQEILNERCPYIERLGVCLEPDACFLQHNIMNMQAQEFRPQKKPTQETQQDQPTVEEGSSADLTKRLTAMGLSADYDEEEGLLFVEMMKDCKCCKGFINSCNGEACKYLGFCQCLTVMMHSS